MATYTQCKLRNGQREQTAWIPTEFAVRGHYLRIGDDDGWRVVSVGGEQNAAYIKEHERDYKRQRSASDV